MSTNQSEDLNQLRSEVAAFNTQMHERSLRPDTSKKALLPFALGAGMALGVFVLVSIVQHLA
jgi:hypothetical protein